MSDELKTLHNKRGYLNDDFLFFHLKECKANMFEYHYHDFYKIIVFISGKVTYLIEGKKYILKPWDILLITSKDIHTALIETSVPYERIIFWFDPKFFERSTGVDNHLLTCFDSSSSEKQFLLRLLPDSLKHIKNSLLEFEDAHKSNLFGADTMKNSLFLILGVYLNRAFQHTKISSNLYNISHDETINSIINYINEQIGGDLTIEALSKKFYLSRYSLMHKFKLCTGFTVHGFILQKRLLLAGTRIKERTPLIAASYACGFTDYSSFVRAFKKFYGVSPRQFTNDIFLWFYYQTVFIDK